MIGALFHNYEYVHYRDTDWGRGRHGSARIDIELNAVPGGEVEFVLAMPSLMQHRKGLIIHESPQVGQGVWEVSIDASSRSGRNGLYAHQLNGAYLEFTDGELIDSWKTFVWNAPLGSRVHFNWVASTRDGLNGWYSSIAEYGQRGFADHRLDVELGVVPNDRVEFVLENLSLRRVDITIIESPSVGGGIWTLSTDPYRLVDQNGLYMYQVRPGASLWIQSYGSRYYGGVVLIDIGDAIPGTRYTFKWRS